MLGNDLGRCLFGCVASLVLGLSACASNSESERVTILLDADAACYGFQIDVPHRAGVSASSQAVSCVVTEKLAAAGCSAAITVSATELHLGTRGCFVPDGTPLFDCELPASLVREAKSEASVHCGCGCAAQCPQAPEIHVCNGTPEACAKVAAAQAPVGRSAVPADEDVATAAQLTTTTSVTTSSIVWLCDLMWGLYFGVGNSVALSEIEFEFKVRDDDGPRCPYLDCDLESPLRGPSREYHYTADGYVTERICISDASGLAIPTRLAVCSYISESEDMSGVQVLRALGPDLAPVTPLPLLTY